MKRVVSVSIGSSTRNHSVEMELLGEEFLIERIGTDGDMNKAIQMIKDLDGRVDAFGMGGIDLYVRAGNNRYTIREAKKLARAAKISPIVDGTGLKNSLERRVVGFLAMNLGLKLRGKKVLVTAGVDRFGMAEAFAKAGCECLFGDLIWALGIPIPVRTLRGLENLARTIAPVVTQLPFSILYPTGKKQEKESKNKFAKYYEWADIVAGDYLYVRRYMPKDMRGKIVVTNTVTASDVDDLRERGVELLVTSTPNLMGRSFGTNMMEAVLVAISGKHPDEITPEDYLSLLDSIGFAPRVEYLNSTRKAERVATVKA